MKRPGKSNESSRDSFSTEREVMQRRRLMIMRAIGESFEVGDNVTITVHQIRGGTKARISIEAPDDVKILRSELKRHEGGKDAAPVG